MTVTAHALRPHLVAVAGLVAAFAIGAPSASAATTVDCAFAGLPGSFAPSIQPVPATAAVGFYEFSGDALTCSYSDTATGVVVPTTTARIRSTGDHVTEICSTGWWFGHTDTGTSGLGTTVDFGDPRGANITQMSYTIRFVGFVGAMTIDSVNGNPAARGGGVVHLEPTGTGSCLTGVRDFALSGHFAVEY